MDPDPQQQQQQHQESDIYTPKVLDTATTQEQHEPQEYPLSISEAQEKCDLLLAKKEYKQRVSAYVQQRIPSVSYDFASLPKSMYVKATLNHSPAEEVLCDPMSLNDMMKLKEATRERLRVQRRLRKRERGRNDLFTHPEKYITTSTDSTGETPSEEVLFLESFCAVSHSTCDRTSKDDASDVTVKYREDRSSPTTSISDKTPRRSATRGARSRSRGRSGSGSPARRHKPAPTPAPAPPSLSASQPLPTDNCIATASSTTTTTSTPKSKKRDFIPPCPKPLSSRILPVKPKSPPKSRPEVFLLPVQQRVPSPRALSGGSPRMMTLLGLGGREGAHVFGDTSWSDNINDNDMDDGDVDRGHVLMAKQLEREARRRRNEEAGYLNYLKFMESLSTEELQSHGVQAPKKRNPDSWLRAKQAHEKIAPKEPDTRTAALKEEWAKLEEEKKTEILTVQRGTGKVLLQALFSQKPKKKVRKSPTKQHVLEPEVVHVVQQVVPLKPVAPPVEKVVLVRDVLKDCEHETYKKKDERDLVEVMLLPSSYVGSSPPPSPRSMAVGRRGGDDVGDARMRKRSNRGDEEKEKRRAEEEQRRLKAESDEYMEKKRLERERLMLDFSQLRQAVPVRGRR